MKAIQSFLFALLFIFVGSLVEAQSSTVFVRKGFFGEDRLKVVFADADASMCEASFFWDGILNDGYDKMKTKSCNDLGNGSYELVLEDFIGAIYKAKYSHDGGLVLTYGEEENLVFGYELVLNAGENKFTMIIAGENSYFSFDIPKKGLSEEVFVLASKAAGKKFNKQFRDFALGTNNSIEFDLMRESNWDEDSDGKGRIKMTRPDEESIIIEFTEKGKSTFFTAK
jgi:hypothetical protein